MLKIKFKTKDCHLAAKVKFSSDLNFDSQELDSFSRKLVRGFLKPRIIKPNVIEYSGPIGTTLYDRLSKPISKYDFFFLIEQVVDATRKLQKYDSPWNNVIWDLRYSFVNETTKEVQFIYFPTINNTRSANIMGFIESIIYSANPIGENDTDFVSRFVYFLKDLKQYDPQQIEDFIKAEDKTIVKTIRKHTSGGSGFITDKPKDYYDHYNDESNDDEPTGLLDDKDEDTGLLEEDDEATGLLNEPEDEATGLLNEDEEATGLLIENKGNSEPLRDATRHYASITRIMTSEQIYINKPVFRLGKERSYVDYFVTNNNAVSRSHADIITRGNRYFVKDLNSKNKTYINGQAIPVETECEIFDGNSLKLGNEEFVFNI